MFTFINVYAQIKKENNFPDFPIQNNQKKIWNDNKEEVKKDTLRLEYNEYIPIFPKNKFKKDSSLSNFEFRRTEKRIFVDNRQTLTRLKLGFGNYTSGLWGFYLKSYSGKYTTYEFDASQVWRRYGAVQGRLSGENDLALNLKVQFNQDSLYQHTFTFEYERQKRGFYGYSPTDFEQMSRDTIPFNWQRVKAQGFLFAPREKNRWHLKYFIQNLNQKEAKELQLGAEYSNTWKVNQKNDFNFILDLLSMSYGNELFRTWWNNHFQWKGEYKRFGYAVNTGVVIHNDGIENPVNPYININGTYQFSPKLRVKTNIGNQIIKRTLDNTRLENPFLNPFLRLRNDEVNFLELKTIYYIQPNWEVQLQLGHNRHKYRALFYNMPTDSGKFSIFYDGVVENHLKINTTYQEKEHQLTMQMSFFNYQTTRQAKAWHLPRFTLLFGWKYQPQFSKWQINTQIEILSGMNVLSPDAQNVFLLQPIANGKVEGEYLLAKKFSAFFSINNLFFQKYERYLSYIQVPFHFTIGLKYELRR
ncbi:MAG: hypothetical protein EAZ85_04960 [Bacteroidetes bacterium]|nr:MAG: hypothetical protein EAZ85_04960 [Bacteroidota bacterium]